MHFSFARIMSCSQSVVVIINYIFAIWQINLVFQVKEGEKKNAPFFKAKTTDDDNIILINNGMGMNDKEILILKKVSCKLSNEQSVQ